MTRTIIDWSDVETAAQELADNHAEFDSFAWWERPEDDERWAVVYVCNRDSGLIDQSNASVVEQEMAQFEDDVIAQRHSHWACGWVDGYVIRVYRPGGSITDAFRRYCELRERMEDYPLLDEEDYSRREYEAAIENIKDGARRLVADDAPEGWEEQVYSWLSDNTANEENTDDQGAYPSEESLRDALLALDLIDPDVAESGTARTGTSRTSISSCSTEKKSLVALRPSGRPTTWPTASVA